MMKGLDKYLEQPFHDGIENYIEQVCESFSNDFWIKNEEWTYSEQFNLWVDKLCYSGHSPKNSAKIIERAFKVCGL